jgi:mannosyltransferase
VVVPGDSADPLDAVPGNQSLALRARYIVVGTDRLSGLTVSLLQRKP